MLLLVRVSLIATGMKIQQEGSGVRMLPRSGGQPKKGKLRSIGAWDLELLSLGLVLAHMLDPPCPK